VRCHETPENHYGVMACGFCFLLGSLMPNKLIHAQSDKPSETYYMLSFMKTRPGQNAFKMERELWKPIQRERVDKGGHRLLDSYRTYVFRAAPLRLHDRRDCQQPRQAYSLSTMGLR
jgi:hypothetical protein